MARPKVLDVPYEIHSAISSFAFHNLGEDEIRSIRRAWCSVCRNFRGYYQPELYRSVKLFHSSTPTATSLQNSFNSAFDDRVPLFLRTVQNSPEFATKVTAIEIGGSSLMVSPNSQLSKIPPTLPAVKHLSLTTDVHWTWETAIDRNFLIAATQFWDIESLSLSGFTIPLIAFRRLLRAWPGIRYLGVRDLIISSEIMDSEEFSSEAEYTSPQPEVREVVPKSRKGWASIIFRRKTISASNVSNLPRRLLASSGSISHPPEANPTSLRPTACFSSRSIIIQNRDDDDHNSPIQTLSILTDIRPQELQYLHVGGSLFMRPHDLSSKLPSFSSLRRIGKNISSPKDTLLHKHIDWLVKSLQPLKSTSLEVIILQWAWRFAQSIVLLQNQSGHVRDAGLAFLHLDREIRRLNLKVVFYLHKGESILDDINLYGEDEFSKSALPMLSVVMPLSWASGNVSVFMSQSPQRIFEVNGLFWKEK